ncbi:MAG: pentapeptide repeat-containing protein, partial [Planktothrix sp.]
MKVQKIQAFTQVTIIGFSILLLTITGCQKPTAQVQLGQDQECFGCDFSGKSLQGQNLTGAKLNNSNFSKADLKG